MPWPLQRICWQGIQFDHPADWELTRFSGPGEPGRCLLADRYFQRLDVRWQVLNFAPRLELLIEKYRKNDTEDSRSVPLEGGPAPWQGLLRRTPKGSFIQAARMCPQQRLLVEATIVWPETRQVELERAILASIAVMPPGPTQLWQAMGLSATIPGDYQLRGVSAKVGRIRWEFVAGKKTLPRIAVERIALPEYWLKGPLRDWVAEELPPRHEPQRQELALWGNHRGQQLISRASAGTLAWLRGRRRIRLDMAWQCELENRVYHLEFEKISTDSDVVLPELLAVHCCRQGPVSDSVSRRELPTR